MKITFNKYQGTGNDFVLIDDRKLEFPSEDNELVAKLCDRRFGVGADGLILLQPHPTASYFMKYYNSDGRESSMCGNGGRCIAAFAIHQQVVTGTHTFMAVDGLHEAIPLSEMHTELVIKLKMKDVSAIESRPEQAYVLNTGSPHFIQFLASPLSALNLVEQAKQIRYNNEFKKDGINVNFVNAISEHEIVMRTYERGVEDETLSCGTGVTAAALGLALFKNLPQGEQVISVKTAGGALKVWYNHTENTNNQHFNNIYLEGPATFVYQGSIEV